MRHEEFGEFGATRDHLLTVANIVESVSDKVVQEWLPEAMRAMLEGGWTKEDFSLDELEAEARYLLTRLPERLRLDHRAPQTPEEKQAFRLFGGPRLPEDNSDARIVSLFKLYSLFTHFLTAAILGELPPDWPPQVAIEIQAEVLGAVRQAADFATPCQFVESAEERLRKQHARIADIFRRMLNAQEDERKRIARDVHDVLAQTLSTCRYRAETCALVLERDPETAGKDLIVIARLIGETLEQVRNIIFDLRPRTLDKAGLAAAAEAYVERMRRPDAPVQFDISETGDTAEIDETVKTALYRIIQEAIANILQHSQAAAAEIVIERTQDRVRVLVRDMGRGFDLEEALSADQADAHMGLLSMRERCQLLGGEFDVRTAPGEGTRLEVSMPLGNGR